MKKIAIAGIILAVSSTSAFAQSSSTANGVAQAVVVGPLQLYHVTNAALNFGSFTAGAGGTVAINPAGAATFTGPTQVTGSAPTADGFTVAGDPNRSFSITLGTGTITDAAGDTMAFTTIVPSNATSGTLNGTGTGAFTVGGTLTVASGQHTGSYAGSYPLTITYQ